MLSRVWAIASQVSFIDWRGNLPGVTNKNTDERAETTTQSTRTFKIYVWKADDRAFWRATAQAHVQ